MRRSGDGFMVAMIGREKFCSFVGWISASASTCYCSDRHKYKLDLHRSQFFRFKKPRWMRYAYPPYRTTALASVSAWLQAQLA